MGDANTETWRNRAKHFQALANEACEEVQRLRALLDRDQEQRRVDDENFTRVLDRADTAERRVRELEKKLVAWRFDDDREIGGEGTVCISDGFGGHCGEVYRNVNDKWYCSPTVGRQFDTMEEARDALCAHLAEQRRAGDYSSNHKKEPK